VTFHLFAQKSPVNGFLRNLNVPLVDVINCDKFYVNLFKGLNFTGGQIPTFSIGIWRRRYNSDALPRRLWYIAISCDELYMNGIRSKNAESSCWTIRT